MIRNASCYYNQDKSVFIFIPFESIASIYERCVHEIQIRTQSKEDFEHLDEDKRILNRTEENEVQFKIFYKDPYSKDEKNVISSLITLNNSQVGKCFKPPSQIDLQKVGIAVGSVFIFILSSGLLYCFCARRKENEERVYTNPVYSDSYYAETEVRDMNPNYAS